MARIKERMKNYINEFQFTVPYGDIPALAAPLLHNKYWYEAAKQCVDRPGLWAEVRTYPLGDTKNRGLASTVVTRLQKEKYASLRKATDDIRFPYKWESQWRIAEDIGKIVIFLRFVPGE